MKTVYPPTNTVGGGIHKHSLRGGGGTNSETYRLEKQIETSTKK